MKPEIKYNKDSKVVSIRISRGKSVDSDVRGNIVIDYDEDGEIVNIDVMNVSLTEFSKIRKLMPSKEFVGA